MGGKISVKSIEGQGSNFTLSLTLLAGVENRMNQTTVSGVGVKRNYQRRVLLSEDNVVNQKITSAMLERLGVETDIASNGKVCLELLRKRTYDLVLMDVHMPELDGLETTRRIRSLNDEVSKVPVIAMTASVLESDYIKCMEVGMDRFIAKPVNFAALINHLDHYFSSSAV